MKKNQKLDITEFHQIQRKFVRERDWEKFHTPKNLVMALAGEAGELLEIFQWLSAEESETIVKDPKKMKALRHELSDILYYLLRLSDKLGVDLEKALLEKMKENKKRYPVKLAKGTAKKYTELLDEK